MSASINDTRGKPLGSPLARQEPVELSADGSMSLSPPDRFQVAWLIFVLLGVGGLFPWNAFLTATDYFTLTLFNGATWFPFIMSIVFNIATITFQFLLVGFGERIPLTFRMMWTFVPMFIAMMIMPFVNSFGPELPFGEYSTLKLGVTLALVFISGMSTAVGFNCVIGFASQFPPEYVTAVMVGQGVAGVIVGLLRIVTKVALGETTSGRNTAALIYFVLAAFIEFTCIIGYFVLIRLPFSKYTMNKATSTDQTGVQSDEEDDTSRLLPPKGQDKSDLPKASVLVVLKKLLLQGYSVWSVFFITLSLFPGITSIIPLTATDWPNDLGWFIVINIFIFQLFDFVGRTLPRWFRVIPARILWIITTSRVVFGALFILCLLPSKPSLPIFHSNFASFVIMIFFALTNGYCGTLAMMYGPANVEVHEKNLAGMIMSVFLQLGIFMAVWFSLLLLFIIQPCGLPSFLQPSSLVCATIGSNSTNTTMMF